MTNNNGKFEIDLGYQIKFKEHPPKWPELFIELAVRAMRRVHLEYGVWSVGQQGQPDFPMLSRLNGGPGIELADERAVCAAITLEFINSQMTSGIRRDEPLTGAQMSHYDLDREWHYEGSTKSADITLRRICAANGGNPLLPRVVIECKRFQLARPARDSNYGITGDCQYDKPQLDAIQKDVCKLLTEMSKSSEPFFAHIFVWGVWPVGAEVDQEDKQYQSKDLSDVLKELQSESAVLTVHQIRWLPLDCETPNQKNKPTKIARWLWASLIEVTKLK